TATASERAERMNVLLVVSDDQRADTIRSLGNSIIQTPALDTLEEGGFVFRQAMTAIPLCVPSRAELLTGRNGLSTGRRDFGFSPKTGVPHLAATFRDTGYDTCYVGKWHTEGRPQSSGYAQTEGLYSGGADAFRLSYPTDFQGRPVTG